MGKTIAFILLLGTALILPASADDWHRRGDRYSDRVNRNNPYYANDPYYNNNPYYADGPYYNGGLTAKEQREYYKEQRKLAHEREKALRKEQREAWKAERRAARDGYYAYPSNDPRYYGYPRR